MRKADEKEINICDLKAVKIGFNENDFLLMLNCMEDDCGDGYAVTIPIDAMKQITDGFIACGKEYQKEFNKDIGF